MKEIAGPLLFRDSDSHGSKQLSILRGEGFPVQMHPRRTIVRDKPAHHCYAKLSATVSTDGGSAMA
jgi:hypothetical protein